MDTKGSVATVGGDSPSLFTKGASSTVSIGLLLEGEALITRRNFLLSAFGSIAFAGMMGLSGCDSAKSGYVKINEEELSLDGLREAIQSNELSVRNDYVGKEIEVCAPLISVESAGSTSIQLDSDAIYSHNCPNGWISIGTDVTRYLVEIEESEVDIASSLNKGDIVHVTGVFSGFYDLGGMTEICLFSQDELLEIDGSTIYGTTTHIEKR